MKSQVYNRKQLLRGQFNAEHIIRPPWSIEEPDFVDTCTRCYQCAEACPSHLIIKGMGGFPEMTFRRQGCDYCEACVRACPENALIQTPENQQSAWSQQAIINDECFASRGIVCRSCGEVCESRAIEFKLVVGGNSQINLNTAVCDGCGECVHVCPAHAIKIMKSEIVKNQMETIHE